MVGGGEDGNRPRSEREKNTEKWLNWYFLIVWGLKARYYIVTHFFLILSVGVNLKRAQYSLAGLVTF